ncbi:Zinc resistance conferring protein [Exophiala xenobiotica]|uniref:Zinc resistance conferring protein n=1 Tax=Lithohypha guttulata TaxID=1690604 RepID=A0ABR0KGS3_9EURO|nr:Zinc resistance conferring protein [Lithohypha guttulata]KAK5321612.1 Zinc resistance conferring protein [Exophiala xenobiotica]
MHLSKTPKLAFLLIIDILFFLVELIFNDILSLVVGLWAIRVATNRKSSRVYTYGWQRAETLGALVNGVFLVALCMSIFLEAIQRFVEPQNVSNPKLILVVGCCGLVSNLAGMLLLHEHEKADSQDLDIDNSQLTCNDDGTEPLPVQRAISQSTNAQVPRQQARKSRRAASLSQISVHPTAFRADVIAAAQSRAMDGSSRTARRRETETSPLLANHSPTPNPEDGLDSTQRHGDHAHSKNERDRARNDRAQDLNMTGVFVHVLGDAVGNIGVIASALFIWLTEFKWKFYADPAISILITGIILHSAIPLCTAASRILLQAVPDGLNIDEIKEDIAKVPGVAGCHELHVWQLSDTTLIATVHITVDYKTVEGSHQQYTQLARVIRECLAAYGIRDVTIQPEFFASYPDGN